MLAAMSFTMRSSRCCAASGSAMTSRSLRSRTRGPKAGETISVCPQSRRIEAIDAVQRPHCELGIGGIDQDRDLDLGGGDRLDVDPLLGQRLEHLGGNAGMAAHAD